MRRGSDLAREMAVGALAGAASTWLMGRATTYMYSRESEAARQKENAARNGKASYEVAAEKVARSTGVSLSEQRRASWGRALHYAQGAAMGAVYGALRSRLDRADWAQGLGMGLAVWLLMDELVIPAAGLTPGPNRFPWQTHARGAAGHAVYGLTLDTALDALDRVA